MTINVALLASSDIEGLLIQLGGMKRVAYELNLTTQAVSNWIVRGTIPPSRTMELLRMIARANAEEGKQITWRPLHWDPRFKISYDANCEIAA